MSYYDTIDIMSERRDPLGDISNKEVEDLREELVVAGEQHAQIKGTQID